MEVRIAKSLRDLVVDQGDRSPAEEICGALLGQRNKKSWEIQKFIQLTNTSDRKIAHYIPDQNEWFKVLNQTTFLNKKAKFDLIGVFHTHPHSEPVASLTDINEAGYEGVYWIYSPAFKTHGCYYWDGNEENRQFKNIQLTEDTYGR